MGTCLPALAAAFAFCRRTVAGRSLGGREQRDLGHGLLGGGVHRFLGDEQVILGDVGLLALRVLRLALLEPREERYREEDLRVRT